MPNNSETFIRQVLQCIRDSESGGLLNDRGSDVLEGLSGVKSVGLLQRLVQLSLEEPDTCYAEIGVFQGLTLLSVAAAFPQYPCFGIDNFSLLDPEGKNLGIVRERTEKLKADNAKLINLDFEEALACLEEFIGPRKISVYLIDGAHDYRSQMVGLLYGLRHLHERSVILIDDANYSFVRQSTRDFLIAHPEFKMIFDAYSPMHPANMTPEMLAEWEQGWLNGVNILVRDPEGRLPEMLPPVEDSRDLYVNDWLVHRHQFAEFAPQAADLAQAVCLGDKAGENKCREDLLQAYENLKSQLSERFADRNTYSSKLTGSRFNEVRT